MAKIAVIGAGSAVFARTFLHDLLGTPALDGAEIALVARTDTRLSKVAAYAKKLISSNGLGTTVTATTDRKSALRGADYVILSLNVGDAAVRASDKAIPMRCGVDQAVGDSLGPGGVFRGQRVIPVLLHIAEDISKLCPKALILNYVNPMATVCLALGRETDLQVVGLCHGVQVTLDLISRYTDVAKEKIEFLSAGINHMAWFLSISDGSTDLYPILRERIERPEYFTSDKVRCEVMRYFGYFMTESSEHLSEYLPWFRKRRDLLDRYLAKPSFGRSAPALESDTALRLAEHPEDLLELETGDLDPRSADYCSRIIEAAETGVPFEFQGNVINDGLIENLPIDSCVEVPVQVDSNGFAPQRIGKLPARLAALNASNITVQQLSAEAAITGDTETLFAAVAMDPLTAAVLSLKETRDMVSEMLDYQRPYMPQFEGESMRGVGHIVIPEGTIGVETPIDPALATAHRLKKMFG
jgi:alpha-galactosidase